MTCPFCKTANHPEALKCAACGSWIASPPPVREWLRAREGRMIAGVCRGLSQRFGIPVAALRFAFLLSLILGGWGFVLYVALWIAMPLAPQVVAVTVAPPPSAGPPGAPAGATP
jgi:phage shock protein PspC (stress-responsive transcriptional regulator)